MIKRVVAVLGIVLVGCSMAACHRDGHRSVVQRGEGRPLVSLETVVDRAREKVSIQLSTVKDIDEVERWLKKEMPQQAVLRGQRSHPVSSAARKRLDSLQVSLEFVELPALSKETPSLVLVYERDAFTPCKQKKLVPAGCAVTGNMIEMIADQRQITAPLVSELSAAAPIVSAIERFEDGTLFGGVDAE